MARYQIPTPFLPGFKALLQLKKREVENLAKIVELLPVGGSFQVLVTLITASPDLPQTALSTANMVFSLGGLLLENEGGMEQLAEDLSAAYVENAKEVVRPEQQKKLKKYLLILFEKAHNLKKTFKAYQLLSENEHTYEDSRVITDMRLIFNDDFEKGTRSGLITHQLRLSYSRDNEMKSFFITLTGEELLTLKECLERAVEKEACIKRDFREINFIDFKE